MNAGLAPAAQAAAAQADFDAKEKPAMPSKFHAEDLTDPSRCTCGYVYPQECRGDHPILRGLPHTRRSPARLPQACPLPVLRGKRA